MDFVYVVFQDQHDDYGDLTGVEVIVYATEQTARQHADRHGGEVVRQPVLTKVRGY